jgi:hypothetical protein
MKKLILIAGVLISVKAGAQSFSLSPVKLYPVKAPKTVVLPKKLPAPNTFYKQDFGFFCKQEWNWQKSTKIPVKIRLGHYEYAQKQEGKH